MANSFICFITSAQYNIFVPSSSETVFFFSSQGDERRSEAISMLEESSQAGCLQSSYLLWDYSRRAAVSLIHFSLFLLVWKPPLKIEVKTHTVDPLSETKSI